MRTLIDGNWKNIQNSNEARVTQEEHDGGSKNEKILSFILV